MRGMPCPSAIQVARPALPHLGSMPQSRTTLDDRTLVLMHWVLLAGFIAAHVVAYIVVFSHLRIFAAERNLVSVEPTQRRTGEQVCGSPSAQLPITNPAPSLNGRKGWPRRPRRRGADHPDSLDAVAGHHEGSSRDP